MHARITASKAIVVGTSGLVIAFGLELDGYRGYRERLPDNDAVGSTQTQPRPSNLNPIGEHFISAKFGSGRHEGPGDVIRPENVKNSLAGGDQVVRNDTPVTLPP